MAGQKNTQILEGQGLLQPKVMLCLQCLEAPWSWDSDRLTVSLRALVWALVTSLGTKQGESLCQLWMAVMQGRGM